MDLFYMEKTNAPRINVSKRLQSEQVGTMLQPGFNILFVEDKGIEYLRVVEHE